jgi:hypothetical protein
MGSVIWTIAYEYDRLGCGDGGHELAEGSMVQSLALSHGANEPYITERWSEHEKQCQRKAEVTG